MLINSAFADATSDARIQAYKANRLLSQEIVLPTSTGAVDADEVVVFSSSKLSWSHSSALQVALSALADKYNGWTLADFRSVFGEEPGWFDGPSGYAWPETQEDKDRINEMRKYLSLIGNGELTSPDITAAEALAYLQEQFNAIYEADAFGWYGEFPCKGLDFSGIYYGGLRLGDCKDVSFAQLKQLSDNYAMPDKLPVIPLDANTDLSQLNLERCDLSKWSNLTYDILATASDLTGVYLPEMTLKGTEDLSILTNKGLTNLARLSNVSSEQVMSLPTLENIGLPSVAFTGNEDFSGKSLAGATLFNCTGITAQQISQVSSVTDMSLSYAQYEAWLPVLREKFRGQVVYIPEEGGPVTIQ